MPPIREPHNPGSDESRPTVPRNTARRAISRRALPLPSLIGRAPPKALAAIRQAAYVFGIGLGVARG
jgi:hypothetical protein